ncbi:MAG TPA: hypothetical protein VE990_00660 [Acidimicrobiales bacterium]|nr:hypothetical protein [Acidimicrobiales bacterium]
MAERRPAYYAVRGGGWRDWWSVLHPPYTAWHLGYVCLGAGLADRVDLGRLGATLVAFAAAVGVAAHAVDELHGRPLGTSIGAGALRAAAGAGLAVAVALGIVGVVRVGPALIPFLILGPALVVVYNAEIAGSRLHSPATFALSWGAFPVLTAYVAQAGTVRPAVVVLAAAATFLSAAQRTLSTPARLLRRRTAAAAARLEMADGTEVVLGMGELLAPLETALRAMSWAVVLAGAALVLART